MKEKRKKKRKKKGVCVFVQYVQNFKQTWEKIFWTWIEKFWSNSKKRSKHKPKKTHRVSITFCFCFCIFLCGSIMEFTYLMSKPHVSNAPQTTIVLLPKSKCYNNSRMNEIDVLFSFDCDFFFILTLCWD